MINVIFILNDGTEKTVQGEEGMSVLEVAHANNIDLEGACGGCLACATCHVMVDEKSYGILPKPTEVEDDMLDFAFGVEPTSRLACQVKLTKELDGIRVKLPVASRNL